MTTRKPLHIPSSVAQGEEIDFSRPGGDNEDQRAHDRIPVRSLTSADLPAIVRIDRKLTGRKRDAAFKRRVDEALIDSAIRVSLVAEMDDNPVGFIMARVDFGEFGHTEPVAIIDTIGVDPDYAGRSVGAAMLSQLLMNLTALKIERLETQVEHDDLALLGFFFHHGFAPAARLAFRRAIPAT